MATPRHSRRRSRHGQSSPLPPATLLGVTSPPLLPATPSRPSLATPAGSTPRGHPCQPCRQHHQGQALPLLPVIPYHQIRIGTAAGSNCLSSMDSRFDFYVLVNLISSMMNIVNLLSPTSAARHPLHPAQGLSRPLPLSMRPARWSSRTRRLHPRRPTRDRAPILPARSAAGACDLTSAMPPPCQCRQARSSAFQGLRQEG